MFPVAPDCSHSPPPPSFSWNGNKIHTSRFLAPRPDGPALTWPNKQNQSVQRFETSSALMSWRSGGPAECTEPGLAPAPAFAVR